MTNVAVVGTGTIAEKNHLPILLSLPHVNIVAVCDSNERRLDRIAEKFNITNRYTDVTQMLVAAAPAIDILDVATPGFTHYEITKKGLEAGVNVLVEKPATLKKSQAVDLEAESRKRNLKLGVCQAYRYSEPVIEFQNIREKGGIGTVDRVISIQHGSTIFGLPPWFWDENLSGGILFELGVHTIDLQCYIMGSWKKVINVNIDYDKAINFIKSILATVEFDGGGIGVIDLKWLSSSSFLHQYVSGSVSDAIIKFYPDGLVLQHGDFSPLSECKGELKRLWDFGYSALRKKYYKSSQSPHRTMIENFIHSVNNNTEPLVPISSVFPTISLLEEIWSKAVLAKNEIK